MPTLPLHQGCAASQAMTSSASSCSCGRIFVVHQPVGLAVAAHVDADAGIAVAGEIGVGEGVAPGRAVALAVGQVFEDRRHRVALGVLRQPDAGGEAGAVRRAESTGSRSRGPDAGTRRGQGAAPESSISSPVRRRRRDRAVLDLGPQAPPGNAGLNSRSPAPDRGSAAAGRRRPAGRQRAATRHELAAGGPRDRERLHPAPGRLPAGGADLAAGGCARRTRCRRSSNTCPIASATARPSAMRSTHPYFAGHGYACVRVDMRGTGESDGVLLGRVSEAGAGRRARGARLDRGAALVHAARSA